MHREMNRENWMHREKLSPWTRIWSISLHPHRESANRAARHTQISRLPRDSWLKRRSGSRPWCKLHKQIKTSRKSKQQVLNAHLVYNLLALWKFTPSLSILSTCVVRDVIAQEWILRITRNKSIAHASDLKFWLFLAFVGELHARAWAEPHS